MSVLEVRSRANTLRILPQANFISFLAIAIVEFAVPFLAVSTLGATSATISTLAVARFLPSLLASEAASSLVSKRGFRQVMVIAELMRSLAFLAAAFGAFHSAWAMPLFITALIFVSVAGSLSGVGIGDAVPYLAEGADRTRMYSRLSVAESSADAIGPFVGGVLLANVDSSIAFVICAAIAALAVGLFISLPERDPDLGQSVSGGGTGGKVGTAIIDGLRLNMGSSTLRRVYLWMACYNFGQSVIMSVFVIAVVRTFGLSAENYGILSSAVVIFAIVGAWWAGRVVPKAGWAGRLLQLAGMGTMVAYLCIGMTFLAPRGFALPLLALFLAAEEFLSAVVGILISGYRASYVPASRRPASIAANRATVACMVVAGYAIGGIIGERLTSNGLIMGTGAAMAITSILLLASRTLVSDVDEAHLFD